MKISQYFEGQSTVYPNSFFLYWGTEKIRGWEQNLPIRRQRFHQTRSNIQFPFLSLERERERERAATEEREKGKQREKERQKQRSTSSPFSTAYGSFWCVCDLPHPPPSLSLSLSFFDSLSFIHCRTLIILMQQRVYCLTLRTPTFDADSKYDQSKGCGNIRSGLLLIRQLRRN